MKARKDRSLSNVVEGSENVFADLGLANAEDLRMKAELTRQIMNRIKALGLTQQRAAKRLGLKQPDVSKLVNGRHTGFSSDRLIALLNSLQVDVEIILRPRPGTAGQRGKIQIAAR